MKKKYFKRMHRNSAHFSQNLSRNTAVLKNLTFKIIQHGNPELVALIIVILDSALGGSIKVAQKIEKRRWDFFI